MKNLLIGLLTFASLSAFAGIDCYVNNKAGEHLDFNDKSMLFDSSEPFGLIRVVKANGRFHLSSIVNGEETIVSFKKELSLTKQNPLGISFDGGAGLGSIVCN